MKRFIIFLLFVLFIGCGVWKNDLKENGNKTVIIENVLLDFSNTSRYYKKDSVFSISFYDINQETIAVTILPYYNSLVLYPNDSIGQKSKSFPTHFIEMDNKLFYWYDFDEILKQSTIDKLIEYNIVYFANSNDFEIPENTCIDEKTKGTAYYICKNNFKNYKKVLSSIGVGYYEPPELNCHP